MRRSSAGGACGSAARRCAVVSLRPLLRLLPVCAFAAPLPLLRRLCAAPAASRRRPRGPEQSAVRSGLFASFAAPLVSLRQSASFAAPLASLRQSASCFAALQSASLPVCVLCCASCPSAPGAPPLRRLLTPPPLLLDAAASPNRVQIAAAGSRPSTRAPRSRSGTGPHCTDCHPT